MRRTCFALDYWPAGLFALEAWPEEVMEVNLFWPGVYVAEDDLGSFLCLFLFA